MRRVARLLLWPAVAVGVAIAIDRLTARDDPRPARAPRPSERPLREVPMEMRPGPSTKASPPAVETPPASSPR